LLTAPAAPAIRAAAWELGMRRVGWLGWLAIVGALAIGCTAAGASESAAPTQAPSASPSLTYRLAGGADDLVLRVDVDGGLVGPGFFLTHLPAFSLYGDGTAIFPGPVDTIYPSPLLPNLLSARLSEAELQELLVAADLAGLLGPDASFPVDGIADAPTTFFTTTVDGTTHRISAYALGIDADVAGGSPTAEARTRLAKFRAIVADLGTFLGRPLGETAFAPAGMRLFATAPGQADPELTRQELAWPLSIDPSAGTATKRPDTLCLAVAGPDLTTFKTVAGNANALTIWTAPSGRYSISVRPLLPDESGCPAG
jgi:hypothetical protein